MTTDRLASLKQAVGGGQEQQGSPPVPNMAISTRPRVASRNSRFARGLAGAALAALLVFAFMGYLSADMQLQWENLMALCGF